MSGRVIFVNFRRRQRGFIELPNPYTLIGVGIVIGVIVGVGLYFVGSWIASHLVIGWQ